MGAQVISPQHRRQWEEDGWSVVGDVFSPGEIAAAVADVADLYPTGEQYFAAQEDERHLRLRSSDGPKPWFPFPGAGLNHLVVHERLLDLAEDLLGVPQVRLYQGQVNAKYAGGDADQDQLLHVDYANHTLVVPRDEPGYQHLQIFVLLSDVTEDMAPTRFVPRPLTADVPVYNTYLDIVDYEQLYRREVTATGPAGSLVLYRPDVYHRGTRVSDPRGARFMLAISFKPVDTDWLGHQSWPCGGEELSWVAFVEQATVRQLEALGFPPPGHPYWTSEMLAGVGGRYPALDMTPWREAMP